MRRRRFVAGASLVLGLTALVVVAWRSGVDMKDAASLLPLPAHLLALAALAVHILMRGARISIIGRGIGLPVPFMTAVGCMLAGDAAGAVTPARIGAGPAKVLVLRHARLGVADSAAILLGEVVFELLVLVAVSVALALVLHSAAVAALGALAYAVVVSLATGALLLLARVPEREPPRLWRRLHLGATRWYALRRGAHRFGHGARALLSLGPGRTVLLLLVTVVQLAARLAILPALALPYASSSALGALLAWPLLLLYAGALVPAPAGGGAVEMAFATGLAASLPAGLLAVSLIWWRFYTFYLGALFGGIVLLAYSRRELEPLEEVAT